MTYPVQFNMPVGLDSVSAPSDTSIYRFYKPLPHEKGKKETNELFIPLYDPSKWQMFNPTAEVAARFGLTGVNPLAPIGEEPVFYTWYFTVGTHSISNFKRKDGSTGFASVICPVRLNDYLVRELGRRPLFNNPRCAHCEAEKKAWATFNAKRDAVMANLGIDRKELKTDGYNKIIDGDPELFESRNYAKSLRMVDKYILNVFDVGKQKGERPMDFDGETLAYQTWLTPKVVAEGLIELMREETKDGIPQFFMPSEDGSLQIIKVIKSTERCVTDWRDTSYNVQKGIRNKFDDATAAYLTNMDAMSDPSDLVLMLPYEEMAMYAGGDNADYNTPVAAPVVAAPVVAAPVVAAPVVAAPVVAAPVVAPVVAAPVVAAPVVAAPVVPVAAPFIPAAVPAAAPVPVVPVMPVTAPVVPASVPFLPPSAQPSAAPVAPAPVVPQGPSPTVPGVPDRTPPAGSPPPGQVHSW